MNLFPILTFFCLTLGVTLAREEPTWGIIDAICSGYDDSGKVKQSEAAQIKETARLLEGIEAGKLAQTRYQFIEPSRLTAETVAGIKDTTLRASGKPVIRFDTGAVTGTGSHVDFNVRGYPNRAVPPVPVPEALVKAASYGQSALTSAGRVLHWTTVATDIVRTVSAANSDVGVYCAARKSAHRQRKSVPLKAIIPVETLKVGTSIGAAYYGGVAGGTYCAGVGSTLVASGLAVFGPPGWLALAGPVVGYWTGALVGGTVSALFSSYFAETTVEAVLG